MTEEMKQNLLSVLEEALSKKNTSTDFIMAYFKFACTCKDTKERKKVLDDVLPQFREDLLQLMPRFDSELYTSVSRWGREHARLLRSMRSGLEFFKEDIVDDDLKECFKNFMDEGDAPDELHFKLKDYAGNRAEWDTGADPIDLRACEPSTHTWWSELERKDSYIKFGT